MSDDGQSMFVDFSVNDPNAFRPGETYTLDLTGKVWRPFDTDLETLLDELESADLETSQDQVDTPVSPDPNPPKSATSSPPECFTKAGMIRPEDAYSLNENLADEHPELAKLATKNYDYIRKQGQKDSERLVRALAYNMAVETLGFEKELDASRAAVSKIREEERLSYHTMPVTTMTPLRVNVKKLNLSLLKKRIQPAPQQTPEKPSKEDEYQTPNSVQSVDSEISFRRTSSSRLGTLGQAISNLTGVISKESSFSSTNSEKSPE